MGTIVLGLITFCGRNSQIPSFNKQPGLYRKECLDPSVKWETLLFITAVSGGLRKVWRCRGKQIAPYLATFICVQLSVLLVGFVAVKS